MLDATEHLILTTQNYLVVTRIRVERGESAERVLEVLDAAHSTLADVMTTHSEAVFTARRENW